MDSENDDRTQTLPLLSQKHLLHSIDPTKASYCHIHDLLAVIPGPSPASSSSSSSNEVTVYRAVNGQVAFLVKHPDPYEEDVRPCLLSWKPDGSVLGVGWEDGGWCLYSGEDGRLVARLEGGLGVGEEGWRLDLVPEFGADDGEGGRMPGCLGWTAHRLHGGGEKGERSVTGETSTEDWFDGVEGGGGAENGKVETAGIQDLLDSITALDVTKVLPGLSALPAHGARGGPEAAKFATQSGVDTTFSSPRIATGCIDTLLISDKCGPVNIFLDDSVKVGTLDLDIQDAMHASHPQCASQVLLSRSKTESTAQLHFIDLPLDILGGSLLRIVASNTKRLQSLITYITQTVRCLQHDFMSGQQLPTRILSGLREELKEKREADPITALFELLMTGKFTPVMTEWLTDTVKDTLRNRWEQSLVEMYHNVQNHIFVHMLPALDCLSIAASALRGQARLHEGTSAFDVPSRLFDELDDSVDALRLVAMRTQLVATAEYRQFYAFIKWVKVMADVATLGPGSKIAIETEQKEVPGLDVGHVGNYIRQTMGRSKLAVHVEQLAEMRGSLGKEEFLSHPTVGRLSRGDVVSGLKELENATDKEVLDGSSAKVALNLPALTARLIAQARLCLEAITRWQQSMLSKHASSKAIASELPTDPQAQVLDLKMFPAGTDESMVYVLVRPQINDGADNLKLFRVRRKRKQAYSPDQLALPFEELIVLHAHIHDEYTIFVLLESNGASPANRQYSLVACRSQTDENGNDGQWSRRILYDFPLEADRPAFKPRYFLVGGRPGKEVVVIFGADDRTWQVLDLARSGNIDEHGRSKHSASYGGNDDDEMKF